MSPCSSPCVTSSSTSSPNGLAERQTATSSKSLKGNFLSTPGSRGRPVTPSFRISASGMDALVGQSLPPCSLPTSSVPTSELRPITTPSDLPGPHRRSLHLAASRHCDVDHSPKLRELIYDGPSRVSKEEVTSAQRPSRRQLRHPSRAACGCRCRG